MKVFLLTSSGKTVTESMYPLRLCGVSAMLKQKGHHVQGMDLSRSTAQECVRCLRESRADVIGLYLPVRCHEEILAGLKSIKEAVATKVIAFGSHAALSGEDLLRDGSYGIDIIIRQDEETVFAEVIEALKCSRDLSGIEGIWWKKDGKVVCNPDRRTCADLDGLPFPDRDLFPLDAYKGMICRNRKYTQIVTGRGCPHQCAYCYEYKNEPTVRLRSARNVVDEMEHLVRDRQMKEIHVEDANFVCGNSERVKDICREILRRGLKFEWQCSGVIPLCEMTDLTMIDLMARAGCYNISIGVETFDLSTLEKAGRVQSTELISKILEICRRNDVEVSCHTMIGFPGQSLEDMRKDVRRSRSYPFDFIHYNIYEDVSNCSKKDRSQVAVPKRALQNIQRMAYAALIFKPSVLKFLFRRLSCGAGGLKMLGKVRYYLLGHQELHFG